jgi:single-strand DNA-binding protein
MAGEPNITIVGNATGDAELRFIPSGAAVSNFTLACTPRKKVGDNWEDGETVFYRVNVWRDMAEHVAETVKRGMRVIVTGRFTVRGYEKDGQQRQSLEVEADEVGVALRYGTASFNKAERQQAGAPAAPDPWATPPPGAAPAGWGAPPPQQAAAPTWAGAPAPAAPPAQAPPAAPPGGWGPPPTYPEPPY